jgi:hypothetical protein
MIVNPLTENINDIQITNIDNIQLTNIEAGYYNFNN